MLADPARAGRARRWSVLEALFVGASPSPTSMRASPEYRLAMLRVLGLRARRRSRSSGSPSGGGVTTTTLPIALTVNGRSRSIDVAPHHTLLDVLRDDLGLTGTKECCLVGECGACTVLVDGRSVDSCLVLAVEADGATVDDRRGAGDRRPARTRSRQAFLDTGAAQCGFCIPGQLVSAQALLALTPHPTRAEIEEGLAGNLCRCAGYEQIIEAVAGRRGRRGATRRRRAAPPVGDAVGRPGRERGAAVTRRGAGSPRRRPRPRHRRAGSTSPTCRLDDVLHVKLVTLDVRARADRPASTRRPRSRVPGVRLVIDRRRPARTRCPASGRSAATARCSPTGETKYHGEPVAAVAAETHDAAEEAARARRASTTRSCPRSITIDAALAPGRAARPGPVAPPRRPARRRRTSCASTATAGATSTPAAAQADVVVEGTYAFPMVTQFAIEPHAFMAAPDGDGIAVWSAIQHPYWLQRVIADAARPAARRRSASSRPTPAAAFGGKQHAKYEPLLAFMALRAGPAGPPRAHARGDVPGRPPRRVARSTSGPGSDATARSSSTTSRRTT